MAASASVRRAVSFILVISSSSPPPENNENAASQHLAVHFDQRKMMERMTSFESLVNLRKSLGVMLTLPELRPINQDLTESRSLGSSRSSSPEGWSTGGRRPPLGIWARGKIPCEFSGCDGFDDG